MNKKIRIFSVAAALISNVHAASIVYDLRDTGATSEIEAGSYTIDGVTMSLSSPQGALNQTSSHFGVNHTTTGGLEETDQIDGVHGIETIIFSFNTAGTLDQLNFTEVGEFDALALTKNNLGVESITLNTLNLNISFLATDTFELTYVSGNGMSWNSSAITAVPEPSSFLLLGFGGLTLLSRRKRPASSNLRNVRFHRPSNHNS